LGDFEEIKGVNRTLQDSQLPVCSEKNIGGFYFLKHPDIIKRKVNDKGKAAVRP